MDDNHSLSRRQILGAAAAVGASGALPSFSWALGSHGAPVRAALQGDEWRPLVLSGAQAEIVATLTETILPSTDTPGAREAKVYEYIDLSLSLDEEEAAEFVTGLEWLDGYSGELHGHGLAEASGEQLQEVLAAVSDEHEELPENLAPGQAFFAELKNLTIFAYYTSEVGRVEELGLPDYTTMETWRGCTHPGGGHA